MNWPFFTSAKRELADDRSVFDRRDWLKRTGAALAVVGGGVLLTSRQAAALTANQGATIVAAARRMINTPYLWGGIAPKACDCSGLTLWAYAQAGLKLPRVAADQFKACTYSANVPGALVFFNTMGAPGTVTHVGINLGNGSMIDANSVAGKVIEEKWQGNGYWQPRFIACATF